MRVGQGHQSVDASDADMLTKCPACGSEALRPYLSGEDYHYGNEGIFQLNRCDTCHLWMLAPMRTPQALSAFYPTSYYSFQPRLSETSSKTAVRKLLGLERRTYLPAFNVPGRLLDVGSGAGQYLQQLSNRGWTVTGIEPSHQAAAVGRQAGLDIRLGDIRTVDLPPKSFDVVRFNHSIEHVPDPVAALKAAHALLKDDGYLIVGVPNTDGLWPRMFGRWWWHLGLPVHVYGFNPGNLRRLLENTGFTVLRIRYNSEFSGLLGSAQIWLNRNKRPRRSTGRVFASRILRVPTMRFLKVLDLCGLGDCIEAVARPATLHHSH